MTMHINTPDDVSRALKYEPRVLPHSVETDGFPAFLGNAQFCAKRCKEGWSIHNVVSDPMRVSVYKPLEFALVLAGNPAGKLELGGNEPCLDTILMLKPVCHYLELQSAHRAQQ